jgi:hypothetical protein
MARRKGQRELSGRNLVHRNGKYLSIIEYLSLHMFREEKSSVDLIFQLGGSVDEEHQQVEEVVEVGVVEEQWTSEV